MTDRQIPNPTGHFAVSVRQYRQARGWTQPQLAEHCRAAGLAWDRSIIANVEAGRRASVSLQEVLTLAHVFEVSPVQLVFPFEPPQPVEVLPGIIVDSVDAANWITGLVPLTEHPPRSEEYFKAASRMSRNNAPLNLAHKHRGLVDEYALLAIPVDPGDPVPEGQWLDEFRRVLAALAECRNAMRHRGIEPPELPDSMRHIDATTLPEMHAALDLVEPGMREPILKAWWTPRRAQQSRTAAYHRMVESTDPDSPDRAVSLALLRSGAFDDPYTADVVVVDLGDTQEKKEGGTDGEDQESGTEER